MNLRRICWLILSAIGIVLIAFGIYWMRHAANTQGVYNNFNNFFTHNPMWNPMIEFFGGKPQQKIPEYHRSGVGLLIAGIICVIIGCLGMIPWRKNKS